jgi:hypothetical protein
MAGTDRCSCRATSSVLQAGDRAISRKRIRQPVSADARSRFVPCRPRAPHVDVAEQHVGPPLRCRDLDGRQVAQTERLGNVPGGVALPLDHVDVFTTELGAHAADVVGAEPDHQAHGSSAQPNPGTPAHGDLAQHTWATSDGHDLQLAARQ